jgi:hypothetical protein
VKARAIVPDIIIEEPNIDF